MIRKSGNRFSDKIMLLKYAPGGTENMRRVGTESREFGQVTKTANAAVTSQSANERFQIGESDRFF